MKKGKKHEDKPLVDKPFATFFKRTKKGRNWMKEHFPKDGSNSGDVA